MNILKFLESLADESVLKTKGSRRDSLEQFKAFGAKTAMAAVPFGLATAALAPQKAAAATAQAAETPTQALQLALTLEYLEDEFYRLALLAPGLIPTEDRVVFQQIADHEFDHVQFLKTALGTNAPTKPVFDFTVGGAFPTFTDYPTFLALAQAFEDTGVRAYKGQAGNLISEPQLLEYALQIHSVEARHAAEVRRLRNRLNLADQKGWITGNDRGTLPVETQPVYNGEDNVLQAGFNTATVQLRDGASGAGAGSESFDEPLTGAQATAIASLFIVS
ncbi:MAG: ferritin-like domain-containing protein [Flavobacterium sp.]|nr:MAG: ferritin-like domain-containing protein [Flavobacterium sp.]